jgi:hypothetical protein
MSQKSQGNKASMKGEYQGHGRHEKETVAADMGVGSSTGAGIRFKVPDMPDKSDLTSPECRGPK